MNFIRYTDPVLGVDVLINIIIPDNENVEVRIAITDFCNGGIPKLYFDYLKRHWSSKCFDERDRKEDTSSSVSMTESVAGDGMSEVSSHEGSGPSREILSASDVEASVGSLISSSSSRDRRPEISGFPHLVQLFSIITENGNDFDISVRTTSSGSTFKIKFGGKLISSSVEIDASVAKELKKIDIKGLLMS